MSHKNICPSIIFLILLACVCVITSGCATMRYPSAYKVAGIEVKKFEELDDEKALKLIALIHNVNHENWEDNIARSLALQKYLDLLTKRKSKYIKDSGVFDMTYEKVNLTKWADDDLIKLYDTLETKAGAYYIDSAGELTETENTERIVYLTAQSAMATEMKKRNNTRNAASIATQVLGGILTIALSML